MRGFNQARLATLEKYLNSVIGDETLTQNFRFKAAERLAQTLDGESIREERFSLAKDRVAARRLEGEIRAAECAIRDREVRLAERAAAAAYVEPIEQPDPSTEKVFADLLQKERGT